MNGDPCTLTTDASTVSGLRKPSETFKAVHTAALKPEDAPNPLVLSVVRGPT